MDFTRTRGADWVAGLGGLLLLVALFLPWYGIDGFGISGWEALSIIDVLLALFALLALAVPLVTAARDETPVPLAVGVAAASLGVLAVLLVLLRVVAVPGPDGVGRDWGLWVALVGVLVATAGSWRALRDERAPGLKPTPAAERQPTPPAHAAS